jgi:pimeloyl-ACP methyl ester carboxylesterase
VPSTETHGGTVEVAPYRVDVEAPVIDDLSHRLARTRLAEQPDGAGWDYGTSAGYLAELVEYWHSGFDWFEQQERMNELPQLLAQVDGVVVHLARLQGIGPNPMPLVLVHGWPSGYLEMTKLAPRLADPEAHGGDAGDAFDVIVPSLPGFGFSGPTGVRGFGYYRAAAALHRVMTGGLGYERYGLHGTGLGAYVNGWMAFAQPDAVAGVHTHDPALMPLASFEPPAPPPSEAELAFAAYAREWSSAEGAYAQLHRTKPQSIGHALNDSPAGLASWLVEKHRSWSDCSGDLERRYSKDEILTSATTYWVTGTITSSLRAYYERVTADPPMEPGRRLPVPTGVAMPRFEPTFPPRRAPREMIDRVHDVHHWVDLPRGGHFVSWEEPDAVADSIRAFFRPLR